VITVEIEALELFGYHGVHEHERLEGQRFLFDIAYDVSESALSDHIADAVDYSEVVALVRGISEGRRFNLIEALAAAVADAVLARFPVQRVSVRVRKPDVLLGVPVAWTGATAERRR
jgi:7,8-dihydroneopterin aldolase/epimerase/oxygenase